tara:strand:- start:1945 stop:2829 length:885 start_codon:yes stop_codon:yes gene_type:complete
MISIKKLLVCSALFFTPVIWGPTAYAEEKENVLTEILDGFQEKNITGEVNIDVYSQYFFRGIYQEDDGLIAQPSLELNWKAFENASLVFGTWNSFHSEETGADGSGLEALYESEFYAGVDFPVPTLENVNATVLLSSHTSPNDAFGTYNEIDFTLGYDDSEFWNVDIPGFEGLQPSITLVTEIDGAADGGDEGSYLELGIAPSVTIVEDAQHPISLTVPVVVGIGLDDYYESAVSGSGNGIGFVDVGLDFQRPLAKNVKLTAGPHFLWLTEDTDVFNSGDNFEIIGRIGVSISF